MLLDSNFYLYGLIVLLKKIIIVGFSEELSVPHAGYGLYTAV